METSISTTEDSTYLTSEPQRRVSSSPDSASGSTRSTLNTASGIGQPLDSDSWSCAETSQDKSDINIQTRKFFRSVDWQALALIATNYREGLPCSYVGSDVYTVGQFNMVRRLDFIDGVRWVARVRLPPEATWVPLDRYNSRRALEIEVASMKFFKSKSTIPVPEVFVYDHNPSNDIGAPYMLIEYIHGTTAGDLRTTKGSAPRMFGTPEQDQRFRQQMAKIQAQVLAFQFPKIGSLYYNEDTKSFYIGPDIDTSKGPWTSSADYYRDLADVLIKQAAARWHLDEEKSTYFCAPVLLNHLMSIYSKDHTGPYNLINRDFGAHNVLVDNDFSIVGVIDFDGVFAGPPEAVAQYPRFTCLDVEPPGIVETNPYALARIEETKPCLAKYREWLIKYEAEIGNGTAPIGSLLGSRGALIHDGFENCGETHAYQNKVWFTSALAMLREYCKAEDSSIDVW